MSDPVFQSPSAASASEDAVDALEETQLEPLPRRTTRTLAPNLSRRSHKKSRWGCLNCKVRKIKCQETRPSCQNCTSRELQCGYPSSADQKVVRRPTCPASSSTARPQVAGLDSGRSLSSPMSFSMDDMRCFHHFLTVAYPHLPLGNDHVWVRDIPVFAQQHDYLMHAILALGATHLTRISDSDYNTAAIVHRGKALKGLHEAIAKGGEPTGAFDPMLAACYALTFQASYMGDGLADFFTMIRGCALVTDQIQTSQTETVFNLEKDLHFRLMEPRLAEMPTIDPTLVTPAILSTEALRPLLVTEVDHTFHASMLAVLVALQTSSQDGYLRLLRLYSAFSDTSHEQFNAFLDFNNIPSQLLVAHLVALQLLAIPLTLREWCERAEMGQASLLLGMIEWAEAIFARMPPLMQQYLAWPKDVIQTSRSEIQALTAENPPRFPLKILRA